MHSRTFIGPFLHLVQKGGRHVQAADPAFRSLYLSPPFAFVLPCIGTMLFTSIYGIVDGLCVSNFVGKTAFAAVNLIMPLPMLLGTIGFMLAPAAAHRGHHAGRGRQKKADRYFTLFLLAALISVSVLAVLGIVFLRPIAVLLGAKGELLDYAVRYGRILMVSLPTFALQNMFQSFFVTAEKPHLGFWFTVGAGCTNMVLDVLMVGIWGWGVEARPLPPLSASWWAAYCRCSTSSTAATPAACTCARPVFTAKSCGMPASTALPS